MEKITARTNEKIKYASHLAESASFRRERGEFLLEGARLCSDAAQTGVEISAAFFTAKALWKYPEYIESIKPVSGICYEISAEVSQKLSGTENPQGVFCICRMQRAASGFDLTPGGKYLALENIQDPSNLGAICRSAEAIGIDGLLVSGGCDIYNPKALRASMGSLLRMYVAETADLPAMLAEANEAGMLTLASVPSRDAEDIRDVDKSGGVVCCVGNEGSGLSDGAIAACRKRITIPMGGRAESLNAAAASAILAWELKR